MIVIFFLNTGISTPFARPRSGTTLGRMDGKTSTVVDIGREKGADGKLEWDGGGFLRFALLLKVCAQTTEPCIMDPPGGQDCLLSLPTLIFSDAGKPD